jgi:hypothetical protein
LVEIVIESKRVDKYTVESSLQVPDRIKKYIKTPELFVIYDKEIPDNESILHIPLVSNVLPLAWLTDCARIRFSKKVNCDQYFDSTRACTVLIN